MSKITEKKWYPWLVVILLSGVAFLNYMDRQMLSTMRFAMDDDIVEVTEDFNSVTFEAEGLAGVTIPVASDTANAIYKNNVEWTADCSADWIQLQEIQGDSIQIRTTKNEGERRNAFVTIKKSGTSDIIGKIIVSQESGKEESFSIATFLGIDEPWGWGALMAAFMWIYGLMSPISGTIADRINRKKLIVGSLFVWSAVTFLMGYVDTYVELYILRAVMGFSEALYIPAALSLIADIHSGKTRSMAIGIHMTGLYLGQIAGGFGSIFSGLLNWHTVFLICGLVGMIYSVVLILFISDPGREKKVKQESAVDPAQPSVMKSILLVLSNMAFWAVLFVFTTLSMPGWATKNWLPELLANVISNSWGMEIGKAMHYAGPTAVICLAGASFIGAMIGARISDKWVQKNVRGRVYTSSIGLALIVPSLVFMGLGDSMFAVILAILCFGIGYGFFDTNNMPILCQFIPSRQRATAYGFINMSGVLGGAAITTALGNLSLGAGFALLGGVTVLSLLIQLIALRPKTVNME